MSLSDRKLDLFLCDVLLNGHLHLVFPYLVSITVTDEVGFNRIDFCHCHIVYYLCVPYSILQNSSQDEFH